MKELLPKGYDFIQFESISEDGRTIKYQTFLVKIEEFIREKDRIINASTLYYGSYQSISETAAIKTAIVKSSSQFPTENEYKNNKETEQMRVLKYVIEHGLQEIQHTIEQEKSKENRDFRTSSSQSESTKRP